MRYRSRNVKQITTKTDSTLEKVGDKKDEKELWDVPPGYSAAINFWIFPWSWKEHSRVRGSKTPDVFKILQGNSLSDSWTEAENPFPSETSRRILESDDAFSWNLRAFLKEKIYLISYVKVKFISSTRQQVPRTRTFFEYNISPPLHKVVVLSIYQLSTKE